jgi:hypothetical protein
VSKKSAKIALSVLDAFVENSSYEDYQQDDGWTDDEYEKMLDELRKLVKKRRAAS